MKSAIRLHYHAAQNLLVTRYLGDMTHTGVDAAVREVVSFAEQTPTQRHLLDLSGVGRIEVGASLVPVTAHDVLKVLRQRRGHRTAIVAPGQVLHALAVAFSWAATTPTNEMRVFRNRAHATEWLGVTLDPIPN